MADSQSPDSAASKSVEIANSLGDRLKVFALGGKFTLFLNHQLILTSVTRGDGKPGITHPCTPVFGPDRHRLYDLAQHGSTRHQLCQIESDGNNQITTNHLLTDQGYPSGVKLVRTLRLSQHDFKFVMTHSNFGTQPAAVNAGEHCYFDAPQGYGGTRVNDRDITSIIQSHTDGFPIELKPINTILIPGKPKITLSQTGFNFAMIWVGTHPQTGQKDKNYICIEPVENNPHSDFFGSPASFISPNSSRSATFTLSL